MQPEHRAEVAGRGDDRGAARPFEAAEDADRERDRTPAREGLLELGDGRRPGCAERVVQRHPSGDPVRRGSGFLDGARPMRPVEVRPVRAAVTRRVLRGRVDALGAKQFEHARRRGARVVRRGQLRVGVHRRERRSGVSLAAGEPAEHAVADGPGRARVDRALVSDLRVEAREVDRGRHRGRGRGHDRKRGRAEGRGGGRTGRAGRAHAVHAPAPTALTVPRRPAVPRPGRRRSTARRSPRQRRFAARASDSLPCSDPRKATIRSLTFFGRSRA